MKNPHTTPSISFKYPNPQVSTRGGLWLDIGSHEKMSPPEYHSPPDVSPAELQPFFDLMNEGRTEAALRHCATHFIGPAFLSPDAIVYFDPIANPNNFAQLYNFAATWAQTHSPAVYDTLPEAYRNFRLRCANK